MRITLPFAVAVSLLMAACSSLSSLQGDSGYGASTGSITSNETGYGIRPQKPTGGADLQMDWGP
ncbi:hypothetical protein [Azospirillum sp. sgz302134]